MDETDYPKIPYIAPLTDWCTYPHKHLRKFPAGTLFLLRLRTGAVHVCELCRNLESDQSCKARRLTDGKIIRVENAHNAEFIVLLAGTPVVTAV